MHLETLRKLGVPYSGAMLANAAQDLTVQANPEAGDIAAFRARYPKAPIGPFTGQTQTLTEMDALIAYLQVLGTMVDFSSYNARTMRQAR
jgi:cytochrome c oxidase cbb3-type subunit 2